MLINSIELGAVIFLTVLLAVFIARYEKQRRALEELKKQRSDIEFQARQKALRLLDEARDKAMKIIIEATSKADKDQINISAQLHEVAQQQQEIYKQMLQNVSKTVEGEAMREITGLTQSLEKETIEVQKSIEEKLQEQYNKTAVELDQYKINKLKEINLRLVDMLSDISRTLIGKSLSTDEHTEVVVKTLAEAKKKYGL